MTRDSNDTWPEDALSDCMRLLYRLTTSPTTFNIIDVGAHDGETISSLARLIDSGIRCITIEPNPNKSEIIKESIARVSRDNITIEYIQSAVGAIQGCSTFYLTKASAVAGVLEPEEGLNARVPSGDHEIVNYLTVPITTVDLLGKEKDIGHIHLLKIDTEGFDLEVLRGATDYLEQKKVDAVITEAFFVKYRKNQSYFWDIAKYLEEMGYFFVNLYDTRNTTQGRLYTCNAVWVAPRVAAANGFL